MGGAQGQTAQGKIFTKDISSAAGIAWAFRPEGGTWAPIQVPAGGWRAQGHTCDAGTYRAQIPIPRQAEGQVVRLAFEAVNFGAEIFAGPDEAHLVRVAAHVNGWMPFTADVSALAVPGDVLHVQVVVKGRRTFMVNGKYTVAQGADWYPDVADGILRGVTLELLPAVHIGDVWIRTHQAPDTLHAQVTVTNAGRRAVVAVLESELLSWNASTFDYPNVPDFRVALEPGESRTVALPPVAWMLGPTSYWWPNVPYRQGYQSQLHILNVALNIDGKVVHACRQRFGFRQFQVSGNRYLLNGIPCNLRGDNQQEANFGTDGYGVKAGFGPPTDANPGWPRAVDNLLRLNFNVMRMHQIPATPYMLDVCDEMGLMLVDETPLRGSGAAEDFVAGRENMLQGARELVLRDRRHPAIVLWSAANEWAEPLLETSKAILALDDTRPIIGDGADISLKTNDCPELDPYCIVMQHYVGGMPGLPLVGGTPREDLPYGETEAVWPHDNTKAGFAWMGTGIRIRRLKGNADLRNYILNNAWPNYVPGEGPETEVLEKKVTGQWKGDLTIQPALSDPWNNPLIRLMQQCFHPLAVCDVNFDQLNARSNTDGRWPTVKPCWVAGTRVTRTLAAFNDEFTAEPITVRWQLRQGARDGAVLGQGESLLQIPPGEFRKLDIAFTCPTVPGDVFLVMESHKAGRQRFVEDAVVFTIVESLPSSVPDGTYRLVFLFNGKPAALHETMANDGATLLNDISEGARPRQDSDKPNGRSHARGTWWSATVVNDAGAQPAAELWTLRNLGGQDVILTSVKHGMALAVASESEGTPAILEPCEAGKRAQIWHLELAGEGCYRLINTGSGNLLDVYGWFPLERARVMQRTRMEAAYQLWRLEGVGTSL
ncbi:MAG: RICIN domain-containing protein [Lentisphaerae bacterium]|nr:RICIN domain-containing protein [Lentisphaerota bacterium]